LESESFAGTGDAVATAGCCDRESVETPKRLRQSRARRENISCIPFPEEQRAPELLQVRVYRE
jgi:hypothetical protein